MAVLGALRIRKSQKAPSRGARMFLGTRYQAVAVISPSARTVNPEAYELYLRGTSLANQLSPEGIDRGLQYLRRSTEMDPLDPMLFAGLAVAYSLVGHSSDPEAYIKARVAAQKALELDDSLAEVHEALGMISLYQTWDWKAAEIFVVLSSLTPIFLAPMRTMAGTSN